MFFGDASEPPGGLRVIDPSLPHTVVPAAGGPAIANMAAVCEPGETPITWNQKVLPDRPENPAKKARPAALVRLAVRALPAAKAPPARP